MENPEDLLEQTQIELESVADEVEETTGVPRREFVFMSLVAAAATTMGRHNVLRAQTAAGGAPAAFTPPQQQQNQIQLGNGEAPAEQFMPYPGGTGALMLKLMKERGPLAFNRAVFPVPLWVGPVPTKEEDIVFLPAHKLASLIKSRKITSSKLTSIYLERLKRLNPTLLCAVTIMEEQAKAEAAKADAEIAAGKYRGALHGLPYGVKDLFSTKGVPTTWGSPDFKDRIIDEDAEIVVRLRDAGAVLIAKLSTGLFAQNDQWFAGRTNNPWNLSQGSSGSSAGPASATAAGCVAFGIGTETSGSIVSPTVRCGLSALRPTFGRVSRYGGMVLSWSQDRVGPICRTVEDCAMVFNAVHGVDEKDPSTVTTPFQFDPNIKLASLRIGVDPGRPAVPGTNGGRGTPADPGAPPELIAKLKELGMNPKTIGARPGGGGGGGGGGLGVEGAAAFDEFVQRKAKEVGLDLNNLPAEPTGRGGGGGRGTGAADSVPLAPGRRPASDPLSGSDWNPRFVSGRNAKAMDFIQSQRRRLILVSQWGEFMKDLDMFIGSNADVGTNSQTGHPAAVVPYKFEAPAQGGFGGGRGGGGANATPPAPLNPQPICGVIIGALYNDDKILSVAHQFQIHNDVVNKHPSL